MRGHRGQPVSHVVPMPERPPQAPHRRVRRKRAGSDRGATRALGPASQSRGHSRAAVRALHLCFAAHEPDEAAAVRARHGNAPGVRCRPRQRRTSPGTSAPELRLGRDGVDRRYDPADGPQQTPQSSPTTPARGPRDHARNHDAQEHRHEQFARTDLHDVSPPGCSSPRAVLRRAARERSDRTGVAARAIPAIGDSLRFSTFRQVGAIVRSTRPAPSRSRRASAATTLPSARATTRRSGEQVDGLRLSRSQSVGAVRTYRRSRAAPPRGRSMRHRITARRLAAGTARTCRRRTGRRRAAGCRARGRPAGPGRS